VVSFSVSVQSGDAVEVFSAPVASDGDMFELWSRPASTLGLSILEGAYEKPTIVQGRYLESLKLEVDRLERWWIENVPDDSVKQASIGDRTFEVPLLVHLENRLENVTAAIRLAQALNGTLAIT
jgi:hypothetical protein